MPICFICGNRYDGDECPITKAGREFANELKREQQKNTKKKSAQPTS